MIYRFWSKIGALALLSMLLLLDAHAQTAAPKTDTPMAPTHLRVPALAYDDNSIVLVWNKPDNYADIVDYNVYLNGKLAGSASKNNDKTSPAKVYIDKFYAEDKDNFHVKITVHNFTATDLKP